MRGRAGHVRQLAAVGAVALAALIAVGLGYRGFFTSAQQLREPPPDPPVG